MTTRSARHPHPLSGSSVLNLFRILRRHGRHIEARYLPRLMAISAFAVAGVPLRLHEQLRYGRRVARQQITQPPIMILGHWRSGTTNLHNLMLQDDSFAAVTLLHCALPHGYLTAGRWLAAILQKRLPGNRPMDAVPLSIHEPMSEDFGLVGMSDQTHYGSYFFPGHAEAEFRRTVLFETSDRDNQIARWERDYVRLLQKITYASGGRRLCLKNPPSTGRVPHVLRLFPDARFVFVRRDPWIVHASTCRLMDKFLERFSLQSWQREEVERFVSRRYELIMRQWFQDRAAIPAENLIEVRHEDIVQDPEAAVRGIYEHLRLPGFEKMLPRLRTRVIAQQDYRNNEYAFTPEYVARIRGHVQFVADRWGYRSPRTTAVSESGS